MSSEVRIGEMTIERLVYQGMPVVTFEMVAQVHCITTKRVGDSFQRNRKRFTEGKHYFRLDFAEANQLLLKTVVSPNGLIALTKKGYALLVKPLQDDHSWKVQEQMLDEYFELLEERRRLQEALQHPLLTVPVPFEAKFKGRMAGRLNALNQAKREKRVAYPGEFGSPEVHGVVPNKIGEGYRLGYGVENYSELKQHAEMTGVDAIHQVIKPESLDFVRGVLYATAMAATSEQHYEDLLDLQFSHQQLAMPYRWPLPPAETA